MTPDRDADGPGFAARSDVGLQRSDNEDRFLARAPLFVVADGMGGHQAGEVASQLTIDILAATGQTVSVPGVDQVAEAIERSNTEIRREARLHAEMAGMGTTCTAVVIAGGIRIAHVGDSRAYRFRAGRLDQLTDDHSLVATMVRQGLIDPDDALTDGRRNIITRALGAEDEVTVDVVTADLAPGDWLLLCTDGLHGQVDDPTIAEILRQASAPGSAADRLVDLANAAGGVDNVTVVVIDADGLLSAEVPPATRPRRRRRRILVTLVALLAIAIVGLVAGWLAAGGLRPA